MSKTRRVVAMPPVEAISGKFALESQTISSEKPNESKRYFGARIKSSTTRNIFYYRANPNPDKRESAGALELREFFSFASIWQVATWGNSTKRIQVMADYKAKKELQGKRPQDYKNIHGWIFAVRYAQKAADPDIEVGDTTYNGWPTA